MRGVKKFRLIVVVAIIGVAIFAHCHHEWNIVNKLLIIAVTSSLLAFGGCAGVDPTYADSKKAAAANGDEPNFLTGSRLSKPTTERVVKAVGNNEYNETNKHTSIGNSVGAKSN